MGCPGVGDTVGPGDQAHLEEELLPAPFPSGATPSLRPPGESLPLCWMLCGKWETIK